VTRGLALLTLVLMLGAFTDAAGPAATLSATAGVTPTIRLTSITAHSHPKGTSVVIAATEPVPYVASRPDPLSLAVDFRNVAAAEGIVASLASQLRNPITDITVQPTESLGATVTRVRFSLTQPVDYHVRSEKNTVIVDIEKPSPTKTVVIPIVSPAQAVDPIAALGLDKRGAAERSAAEPAAAAAPIMIAQVPTPAAPMEASFQTPVRPNVNMGGQQLVVAPPPPPPPDRQTERAGQRKFTGHPISLDFQGADLRAVLRTFSEISGLNIVIDPAVQGTVDVALRDVPWDQALDIILRANKLGYIVDGTIVRIAPLSVLADEESQRRKLSDEQALAGELHVLTKTLSYAKADELQSLLTKSALSQRGTVQIDPRTNTLIITDLADRLNTASELIATLDKPQPQVEIEARIVQTNKNYARALGIQWGFTGRVDPALGNTTNLAFPNSGSLSGRAGTQQGTTIGSQVLNPQPTAVNLGVQGATSSVGLSLGAINGAFNLDVALSALESSGNGRLLSTPRVSTQNNIEAEITQGVQIPIQTVANNTVTVSFKDAALTLKVTPQITSADTVIMKIAVENASPDFSRAVNNIPPINTQRANTQVLVSDGQTTVIGGIYVSQEQAQTDRTPGLGRIPLLKWLFKRDSINDTSTELLIFITPRIIKGNG